MQHSHRPAHRSSIPWRELILAVIALCVFMTGKPLSAGGNESVSDEARTYTGIFIGSGLMGNQIVDIEGFANWGQPGYTLDYGDNRFVAGALLGTKVGLGGVRLRIEFDGTFGNLSGRSNRLDPAGLDETAGSDIRLDRHGTCRLRATRRRGDGIRHRWRCSQQNHEFRHRYRFGPRHSSPYRPG